MPRMSLWAVLAILLGQSALAEECGPVTVGYRVLHLRGRIVAVWYPTSAPAAEYHYSKRFAGNVALNAPPSEACEALVPLVVFSHGDLGCGLQSVAFTEELARHGYIVAAPDHADASLCHTAKPPEGARRPEQPNFFNPDAWSDATFADRRADVEAVIDGLIGQRDFGPLIDSERIGAAGHSLGGYTVVGLAGGWESWRDRRIRAVLAMSPYVMPFEVKKTLGQVHVPLMYQGGTLDVGITPFLEGASGAFAQALPPKYLLVLRKAAHFAWVNCGRDTDTDSCLRNSTNMGLITRYGIAFFDSVLRGHAASILTQQNPELASFEFKLPGQ